jgi:hypothetical protein
MDIYYCGFNGFKQVAVGTNSDTLTCLTLHTKSAQVSIYFLLFIVLTYKKKQSL